MATLVIKEDGNYFELALSDITLIDFKNSDPAFANFHSSQFDGVQIADNVAIDGSAVFSRLVVGAPPGNSMNINASGWTFSRWANGKVQFYGSSEDDSIVGSSRNDEIDGRDGLDTIFGGAGNDQIFSQMNDGPDSVDGGKGIDELQIDRSDDAISYRINISKGGRGADIGDGTTVRAIEVLVANLGGGNDVAKGRAYGDSIVGGDGDDRLFSGGGENDFLSGGGGTDYVSCHSLSEQASLNGGEGFDRLSLDRSASTENLFVQLGVAQDDIGDGTSVADDFETIAFRGSSGNDTVLGGAFADRLDGEGGNDELRAGNGNDVVAGGAGDDLIHGGYGDDKLKGGKGFDVFAFNEDDSASPGASGDAIFGFVQGEDVIDLQSMGTLTFVGGEEFTNDSQVRYFADGGNTIVQAGLIGDNPSFQLTLIGVFALAGEDFLLST